MASMVPPCVLVSQHEGQHGAAPVSGLRVADRSHEPVFQPTCQRKVRIRFGRGIVGDRVVHLVSNVCVGLARFATRERFRVPSLGAFVYLCLCRVAT